MSKKNGASITNKVEYNFPQPKKPVHWTKILYNSEENTYLGRTISSWARLSAFYLVLYALLAGLMAICLWGLFSTLKDGEPKWKLHESLIGTNPGMGFRPISEETERGSVIQFDTKKPQEGNYWKELLDTFLKDYKGIGNNRKHCSFNQTHSSEQVCVVDIDSFGPCSSEESYGYNKGRPCIFLKLNKIFNWLPEYYDNVKELPPDMPNELKEHINNTKESERQQIWVSCDGQHSVDKESIRAINYYPSRGFAFYYYPYMNQKDYLSPLIAVQFDLNMNQMVSVECRAWAKNVVYSGSLRDRQGSVTFQFFLD